MSKCRACGGGNITKQTVPSYEADLLGAPFQVVLENSVREEVCESCGSKVATIIPDLEGLILTVAMARASLPRKLSGAEIKFLRMSVGCKAKDVAAKLDLAPEHLSRCENDSKVLSPLAERWFRLFVMVKAMDGFRKKTTNFDLVKKGINVDMLVDMKIEPTWDPERRLRLNLIHRKAGAEPDLFDDGMWEPEPQAQAA